MENHYAQVSAAWQVKTPQNAKNDEIAYQLLILNGVIV